MANIKRVLLTGDMPFNTTDNDKITQMLGVFNAPFMGIRISWGGISRRVPNEHGGETTFLRYTITGEEAVRYETVQYWKRIVEEFGGKMSGSIEDIENGGKPILV